MEQASSFTAVSGWAQVAIGATALAAAWLASRQGTPGAWLAVWLGEAVLAAAVGGGAMAWKARATRTPLVTGPGRKFALSFSPPMFFGVLLTVALFRAGLMSALPGTWLSLYGTAVMAGGAFSVRPVIAMGAACLAAGSAALFCPAEWGDGFMALGFGGLHIVFGVIIARRHGG
jgi:hypothetical protein